MSTVAGGVVFVVALAGGIAVCVACGSAYEEGPSTDADGGGTEKRVDDFACGSIARCRAGLQACCFLPAGATCASLAAGGCSQDGGASGADASGTTSLLCTTYNNCENDDQCCYEPGVGSKCEPVCGAGRPALCVLGDDGCGGGRSCEAFPGSPSPEIGRCQD